MSSQNNHKINSNVKRRYAKINFKKITLNFIENK